MEVKEEEKKNDEEVGPQEQELQQDFHDTTLLPFPRRYQKPKMDEQFGKFVEVIQTLYINIPLLDAIHVPTYAKDLRDILNNKRPLPSTKVIKLIEECSVATPTSMCLQLADQSVCYPAGIAKNIRVKIQNFFVPVDFVVLDM